MASALDGDRSDRRRADWHLAELNIGRLHEPLDHPATAEFVDALDEINALAEASPGFVWRLKDEAPGCRRATCGADDDPLMIINLSVWETPEQLHDFVYRTGHTPFLRRRREWFQKVELFLVCWWVPAGHVADGRRGDGPPRPAPPRRARATTPSRCATPAVAGDRPIAHRGRRRCRG